MKLKKRKVAADAAPSDARLAWMIASYYELSGVISRLDAEREIYMNRLRDLEENQLPNLLSELGVEKVVTGDGTTVEMKETYTASVSQRNMTEAATILKRIGAGGIATVQVLFAFTEQEKKSMRALFQWSKAQKVACEHKTVIPAATLKAVVKRAMEDGKLQPADLPPLGVFAITKAYVKSPKAKD